MIVGTGEKIIFALLPNSKSSLTQRQIKHLWKPSMLNYFIFFLSKQEEEEVREGSEFLKPSKSNTGIQVIKFSWKQREK